MIKNSSINSLNEYELNNFSYFLHDSIPASVLEMPNKKLTPTTKVLYSVILTQILETKYCNKTNQTLSKQVGISSAVVSRYITKLSKMNLLTVKYQFPHKQGHRVMFLSVKNYRHLYQLDSQYRKQHGLKPAKINHKHHHGHFHLSLHNHRHHRKIRFASSKPQQHSNNKIKSFNSNVVAHTHLSRASKNYQHMINQSNKVKNWKEINTQRQKRNQRAMTPSYQVRSYYKTNFGKPVRSKSELTKQDRKMINKVAKEVHSYAPTYPVRIVKRMIIKEWVRKRAIIDNLSMASIVTNYAKNVVGENIRAVIGFLCHISHQASDKLKESVKAIKPKMVKYELHQADLRAKQSDQSLDKYVF